MTRSALIAWIFFLTMASFDPPRLAAQPPAPAEMPLIKQPSLMELGELYQALDLPLPPKEAFFAFIGNFDQPLTFAPANLEFSYQMHFATGGPYPSAEYQVWAGLRRFPGKKLDAICTKPPRPELVLRYLKAGTLGAADQRVGEGYGELIFAIQCHLLQHFDLARFFFDRSKSRIEEPLNHGLIQLAWNYWAEQLGHPKRDCAEIAKKLHLLVDKYKFFDIAAPMGSFDDDAKAKHLSQHQELLDRIDLTVRSTRARPGSVEALMDDLFEEAEVRESHASYLGANVLDEVEPSEKEVFNPFARKSAPSAEAKLRNLGFAAIPLLLDHVDDARLPRTPVDPLIFWATGEPQGVLTLTSRDFPSAGSRVRNLLSTFFKLDPSKATKSHYLDAWKELKKMTEHDFVIRSLKHIHDLNDGLVLFISEKYKTEAIKAHETMLLQEPALKYSGVFVDLIVRSDMPKAAKINLLMRDAQSGAANEKHEAFAGLLQLDNVAFSRACAACLEKLIWNGDGDTADCRNVRLLELFLRTNDRKTRDAVEKYVQNLPINPRLAVLKELEAEWRLGPVDPETLSFLTKFLDDDTVYQDPKGEKTGFKNLDFGIGEMEVRDFATLQILKNLGIDIPPRHKGGGQDWVRLRDFAKNEINRRLENKKRQ